jgi:hypothetical protein
VVFGVAHIKNLLAGRFTDHNSHYQLIFARTAPHLLISIFCSETKGDGTDHSATDLSIQRFLGTVYPAHLDTRSIIRLETPCYNYQIQMFVFVPRTHLYQTTFQNQWMGRAGPIPWPVFWDDVPCSLVETNPEDSHLRSGRRENLKFHQ